jgi:hypothetical protein
VAAEIPALAAAARDVALVLARADLPFCLIGGLAVQRWGEPRATTDVDFSVLTGYGHERRAIDALLGAFKARVPDPYDFALRTRVLLIETGSGVGVDVALAAVPFEQEAIESATPWEPLPSVELRVCPPEHLIVYKLVAGRPHDLVDVTGIVRRQRERLDVERIRHWGRIFADLKEDPDLLRPFEDALRDA